MALVWRKAMSESTRSRALAAFSVLVVIVSAPRGQAQTSLTFRSLTVAGAIHTEANGADEAGDIVGFYIDSSHVEHGFKDVAGKITTINFPGATGTRVYGIDLNHIFIVGSYTDSHLTPHGFRLQSGTFTTIDVPGAAWTRALSVNSHGTIVGTYADKAGVVHGFLDQNGSGSFATLHFPHAILTEVTGIVNLRYMSGIFVDSSGLEHGIFGADGQFVSAVNVPGAHLTAANGVNDGTDVVGYYGASATGPFHGFLLMGGQFETIDFPGAIDTRCNGISDGLQILGRYTDAKGVVHGFSAK